MTPNANVFQKYLYGAITISYALFSIKIELYQPGPTISLLFTTFSSPLLGYDLSEKDDDYYVNFQKILNPLDEVYDDYSPYGSPTIMKLSG